MIALPALVLLFLHAWQRARGLGAVDAAARAVTLLAALVLGLTELLSPAGLLARGPVLAAWGLLTVATGAQAWRRGGLTRLGDDFRTAARAARGAAGFTAVLAGLALAALLCGLLYPPNNWDSLTYHLSRVMHWIERGSTAFYPAADPRQNYQPPLAEYFLLHARLLGGGDRFFALLQWSAGLVCAAGAAALCRRAGGGREAIRLSALLVATLPMGILQASSTQNDLVVAAGAVLTVWFLLDFLATPRASAAVWLGLAGGLTLAVKGTAWLLLPAIGLAACLVPRAWTREGGGAARRAGGVALAALVLVLVNAGIFLRNFNACGSPVPAEGRKYRNAAMSPALLAGNLVRNATLHLGTPAPAVNRALTHVVKAGLGGAANDPRTTLGTSFYAVQPYALHEDFAGNPLHLLLGTGAFVLLAARGRRLAPSPVLVVQAAAVAAGVLLFCLLLRWQVWGSRLHTPLFVLAAPVTAWGLARRWPRWPGRLGTLLVLYALPFALTHHIRPLVPRAGTAHPGDERANLYFANRPELAADFRAAAGVLAREGEGGCGLVSGAEDFEYPLWVLSGRSFRSVGPDDRDGPALVAVTRPDLLAGGRLPVGEVLFTSPHVAVVRRAASGLGAP